MLDAEEELSEATGTGDSFETWGISFKIAGTTKAAKRRWGRLPQCCRPHCDDASASFAKKPEDKGMLATEVMRTPMGTDLMDISEKWTHDEYDATGTPLMPINEAHQMACADIK